MNNSILIKELGAQQLKTDLPNFDVGDTIRIHIRIIEGDKERIQVFTGTVIARKGHGIGETFSVHRVSYGEGVERVFVLNSPRIARIEVVKKGRIRRSKLYYLRGRSGKAAKVKENVGASRALREENAGKQVQQEESSEESSS